MLADIGGHPLSTALWYGDVDLDVLARQIGREALDRLVFHIAAFEINKLCSLAPTHLSFGPYARFVTPRFQELWSTVLHKVWAQWRYEHDLPHWAGPALVDSPAAAHEAESAAARGRARELPRAALASTPEALLCFGGGKDSLVAAQLLAQAGLPYASLTYAHAVYGAPAPQHALIEALLDHLTPVRRHKQWVADDAFAAPLPALIEGAGGRSLLAAETPSSIFGALPLVLARGYRHLVLAHEHSANRGNLVWERTGEDVNHQWGKSWEAEQALSAYIASELVPGFHWFSILQPLSDVLIFELLRGSGPALLATHSCNVAKPWCHRCAKCAYVALGYAAHLEDGAYERVFQQDVLDLPENEPHFRQMIGLGEHTPFECIGEIGEARLALALCAARGRRARAVELYRQSGLSLDLPATLERYARVHASAPHGIPAHIAERVFPSMLAAERSAHTRIRRLLGQA